MSTTKYAIQNQTGTFKSFLTHSPSVYAFSSELKKAKFFDSATDAIRYLMCYGKDINRCNVNLGDITVQEVVAYDKIVLRESITVMPSGTKGVKFVIIGENRSVDGDVEDGKVYRYIGEDMCFGSLEGAMFFSTQARAIQWLAEKWKHKYIVDDKLAVIPIVEVPERHFKLVSDMYSATTGV